MANKKLEKLVEEIQKTYVGAVGEYLDSSMLGGGSAIGQVELCETLRAKINEIYGTNYALNAAAKKRLDDFHESFRRANKW